jgi:hypothetical protein
LSNREAELSAKLAECADAAESGPRRLLTAKGDDLVEAVHEALELLGFQVENRDLVNPPSDRLEDLWVTSPLDDPNWIASVEVRGYSGGAALSDLLRIAGRFAPRFSATTGRPPSRSWYIVNQLIGRDPLTRPQVLAGHPNELAEFASQDGMAMDTADLFTLVRNVELGRFDRDDVRHMLAAGIGRITFRP